jgi:hypothetical protein
LDDNNCKDDCDDGNVYIGMNGICELKDCNDNTRNNEGNFRCGSECYLLSSGVGGG